jgi:hypothetical protein
MHYPPIKSGIRYEVWRWREDVAKWSRVTERHTLEEARERRDEEISSPRYREAPEVRITESTMTRKEVS